jgi:Na+-transporting methylmalonyl-CoA/oxaloacetate decarboxylase gamma subunit
MAWLGIVVVLLLIVVLAITLMGIFGNTTTITRDE